MRIQKNPYTFVWKKSILKNEDRMFVKIEKLISEINLAEIKEFSIGKETAIKISKLLYAG
jgi:hypothetical protein